MYFERSRYRIVAEPWQRRNPVSRPAAYTRGMGMKVYKTERRRNPRV